jgi:hypothetical protein
VFVTTDGFRKLFLGGFLRSLQSISAVSLAERGKIPRTAAFSLSGSSSIP